MQIQHDVWKPFLTTGQAAAAFGVSVDTIRRWEKAGRIEAIRTPTGHRRFRRSDIEQRLEPAQRGVDGAQS